MEYVLAAVVFIVLAVETGYWWLCYREAKKNPYGVRTSNELH